MSAAEPELLRIRQIRVERLFGLYDHCIDMNLGERVTILHGPNGVGKTVTLRMVDALLEGRFDIIGRFPFNRFSLEFTDGSEIFLTSSKEQNLQLSLISSGSEEKKTEFPSGQDINELLKEFKDQGYTVRVRNR